MTKYEKMKKMADNLKTAASNAGDKFIRDLWTYQAEDIEKKLEKMTNKEAMEEYKID